MQPIIAFTGHRPGKLPGGYDHNSAENLALKAKIKKALLDLNPIHCISGLALGIDQLAAEVCIDMNIPFTAAVPCKGQESKWPETSVNKYFEILAKAAKIVVVTPGEYTNTCMQIRNEFMTDHCDVLVACVIRDANGVIGKGGTLNCINYAISKEKTIYYIDVQGV